MTTSTPPSGGAAQATVAVIGGSGFYSLFDEDSARPVRVETPFGDPSGDITVGTVGGRPVAFLPRHGPNHRYPAHAINYRANIWALHHVGVRRVLAPCAVGSLDPAWGPGVIVVPDQVIDATVSRIRTFYDRGAAHVSFADPYCPVGADAVARAASTVGREVLLGGTMVVIEGPRFSSRAESRWYAAAGASLINMTGMPEAVLARELAMCYTNIALVTDLDAGMEVGESVAMSEVFALFEKNIPVLRSLVLESTTLLGDERDCACASALDGIDVPLPS